MRPWTSYFQDGLVAAVTGITPRSASDIVMSADRLTAYRTINSLGAQVMAMSTPSGLYNDYVEIKTSFASATTYYVGIANRFANTGDPSGPGFPGADYNSIGLRADGHVFIGGADLGGVGPNYATGDVVAIAISGATQTVQFRNVTGNTAWFGPFTIFRLGRPPYYLAVSMHTVGDFGYANFYPPFAGTTQIPANFVSWNPEALFSEQPAKVLDFDVVIQDGNYSSTGINDLEQLPFSYTRWGDATVDHSANAHLTDWALQDLRDPTAGEDDWPLFSITETAAAAPADNYIWGQWDFGPTFLIDRFHFTNTNPQYISNIPIPPPQGTPPNLGEGRILTLYSSCSTTAVFNWTNGRVFGTENVLVWTPIEVATWPPSVLGVVQPVIPPGVIQGGRWGPPIGPPLG